jgi:hypothetical protein
VQTNINNIYMNHSQRNRDYPGKDYDSLATTLHEFLRYAIVETILTKIAHDSLVTALALLRDAGIFRRFLTFCIFRQHQVKLAGLEWST